MEATKPIVAYNKMSLPSERLQEHFQIARNLDLALENSNDGNLD